MDDGDIGRDRDRRWRYRIEIEMDDGDIGRDRDRRWRYR